MNGRLRQGQRVFVKTDEDDKPVHRDGTVTRICTDGERAWVTLDTKGAPGEERVRVYPSGCTVSESDNRAGRRAAARESAEPVSKVEVFGKDHWSTFGYLETRIVDHRGEPNRNHMRCHADRHPLMVGGAGDASGYPTVLRGGATLAHHDDWDCADDLIAAGLLVNLGSAIHPQYALTMRGRVVASELRDHKAARKSFADFVPSRMALAVSMKVPPADPPRASP